MKQPILNKGSKPEKNPTSYNNDGFGRDTYISYNNGGNFGTEFRFLTIQQNRTGMNMMPTPASRASEVPQRIFYQCDGTGRDTYVLQNVQEKYSPIQNYKRMLRTSDQFFSSPKYRYQLPPLVRERFKKTQQSQRSLISRLSQPKLKQSC
ncbi:unnamed protein product [Paramecium sonneborni]|uniref:Uncharacterized protein n=1 Tax=Paramecium sonneborni TaxID=65129 RepID=A0A8S1RK40_9CILI|nr:unnamed protein product [Paramecium sonneborni]